MIKQLTIYPAKILAGILAGFLSVFVENLLPLFITVTVFELVDLANDYMDTYNGGFIQSQISSDSHYSAPAYQTMGRIMEKAISDVMIANPADFKYIQFATS